MERKYHSYIKEWRLHRNRMTQRKLIERLVELAGDIPPDDPTLNIPTTEASLSRIENGKQNFTMALLQAIAHALEVEEPGWLLTRNPLKGGEVVPVDFKMRRLNEEEAKRAAAVLEAMFPDKLG